MTYITPFKATPSRLICCLWSAGVRARLQSARVDSRPLVAIISENPETCLGMMISQALFPLDESRNDI
jgi:hypothetical protein